MIDARHARADKSWIYGAWYSVFVVPNYITTCLKSQFCTIIKHEAKVWFHASTICSDTLESLYKNVQILQRTLNFTGPAEISSALPAAGEGEPKADAANWNWIQFKIHKVLQDPTANLQAASRPGSSEPATPVSARFLQEFKGAQSQKREPRETLRKFLILV